MQTKDETPEQMAERIFEDLKLLLPLEGRRKLEQYRACMTLAHAFTHAKLVKVESGVSK